MSEVSFDQFMNYLRSPDSEIPEYAPYWMIYAEVLKDKSCYEYPGRNLSNAQVFLSYAKQVSDNLLESIYKLLKSGKYDQGTKEVIVDLVASLDYFTHCIQNVIMKLPFLENDREYLQLNFPGNVWKNLATECYVLYHYIGDFMSTEESQESTQESKESFTACFNPDPFTTIRNPMFDLDDEESPEAPEDEESPEAREDKGDEFFDAIESPHASDDDDDVFFDAIESPHASDDDDDVFFDVIESPHDRAKALEDNLKCEAYNKYYLVLAFIALITLSLIAFCTRNLWFAPSTEPPPAPPRPPRPVLPTCWINEEFIEDIKKGVIKSPPASTGGDLTVHDILRMISFSVSVLVTGLL
jgi:hypothetical protein